MAKYKILTLALLCVGDKTPKPYGTIIEDEQLTGKAEDMINAGFIEPYIADKAELAKAKAAADAAAKKEAEEKAAAEAAAKAQAEKDAADAAAKTEAEEKAAAEAAANAGNAPDPTKILKGK